MIIEPYINNNIDKGLFKQHTKAKIKTIILYSPGLESQVGFAYS
jgi:hypothetical protein